MIENSQAEELEPNDAIDIEIVDDPAEESEFKSSPDDELEKYTKSVSKRINKLNAKNKQAEDRAAQLEEIARSKELELQHYRAYTAQQDGVVLQIGSPKSKSSTKRTKSSKASKASKASKRSKRLLSRPTRR